MINDNADAKHGDKDRAEASDIEDKVDVESEEIQRKAEKDANPLAPPVNTRAS
jgi:hypothetical protein